jgi:hypothetical protein
MHICVVDRRSGNDRNVRLLMIDTPSWIDRCRSAVEPAVVHAAQDRRRRGQGVGVPARGRDAGDLPRLQGLQHPARLGECLCVYALPGLVPPTLTLQMTSSFFDR